MESTKYTLKFTDGEETKLTLNFAALYALSAENHELYEVFNKVATEGTDDIIDYLKVLYIGYRCANGEPMTFENFLIRLPMDIPYCVKLALQLITPPKKAETSETAL